MSGAVSRGELELGVGNSSGLRWRRTKSTLEMEKRREWRRCREGEENRRGWLRGGLLVLPGDVEAHVP